MTLNIQQTRQVLRNFDFKTLFIDLLGWDRHSISHEISVDGKQFSLRAVAQKRGVAAFLYDASANGDIPDYQMRKKIERVVEKSHHEHLIVFADEKAGNQIWQWVKREIGKPIATREHAYHRSQSGDALIQKLQNLAFSIEDEENLTIVDVTGRLRGFDVERVTRRFYEQFKTEHAGFTKFIQGIPDESLQSWYASFMLDRLMFIYFVQKKNFLDGDPNYLRTKLAQSRKLGANRYYREFLCCLFFEGFAKKERERSLVAKQLLGKVPYLNGGLFLPHQIEERYGEKIRIADTAFTNLYDFFEEYHWHLDERPLRNDKEINPDVLGYILEKIVNQKQMGAYYTKEDITEYIGKNTIIPFLFDAAEKNCPSAFADPAQSRKSIWHLLRDNPDRYIYEAVKKGVHLSLPDNIAAGIVEVPKRGDWNKSAAEEFALPTEIWREVVARRQRYEEVRGKMSRGEVQSTNDLITYNLNIRQFAQDVIASCGDPEFLRAIYHAIEKLTVLDPTCGSGAFLFAALNILEPLYEACLGRMEAFLAENASGNGRQNSDPLKDFREILARVAEHSNRRYFILKAIIVNNLFGVDIMEEAVEICKLRLFLKLAAQAEKDDSKPNLGIEPLPDIDFNIRAGNTLVGFATRQEVKDGITLELKTGQYKMRQLLSGDALERIEAKAQAVDDLFVSFRQQQTEDNTNATPVEKKKLRIKLDELRDELNCYLAAEYGVSHNQSTAYENWLKSHKPFHWFVEFYGAMKNGGFDVIIGNPPYVEYSKIRQHFTVRNYQTEPCGNLFPMVVERALNLLVKDARFGMIVQHSAFCTPRMQKLIEVVKQHSSSAHTSFYECRPGKLFDGIDVRLAISLLKKGHEHFRYYAGRYFRFFTEERPHLFQIVGYVEATRVIQPYSLLKIQTESEVSIADKMFLRSNSRLSELTVPKGKPSVYYSYGFRYWAKALNFRPYFDGENAKFSTGDKQLFLKLGHDPNVIVCLMNSSLFYWYYSIYSDGHNFTKTVINDFPFEYPNAGIQRKLTQICETLMKDLQKNSRIKTAYYQSTGAIRYDEYFAYKSKPIIDAIDRVLAQHYGFTDEELDFIINYDIKYRMGSSAEEE